jgi:MoxR-like ATPase
MSLLSPPPFSPQTEHDFWAIDGLRSSLNRRLLGKADVVEFVLACLLARGHLLLEDLPGLGKTTLAKGLAEVVGGRFARVQCTPDLLPSDLTGVNIFNQKSREFEFLPGPVFTEVLLADEINRTPPRTQSALLEVMAERQVTVDGVQHKLSDHFFVIATQNPIEMEGTYPLPEAQLDRFAMKLRIGYPSPDHERMMLAAAVGNHGSLEPATALAAGQLGQIQGHVARIAVEPAVRDYLVCLADATRRHGKVRLGLSPRGLLTWQRVAQAWAYLKHRDFVTPDDVLDVAQPVLDVRLRIDRLEANDRESDAAAAGNVIREILDSVSVPVLARPSDAVG